MKIGSLSIITTAGAKTYRVGDIHAGIEIMEIRIEALSFQGDPYDHYCGFGPQNQMLFSVNCLCPCEVAYF